MNKSMLDALRYLATGLSKGKMAKGAAEMVTPAAKTARPNQIRMVNAPAEPTVPADVTDTLGALNTILNPQRIKYGRPMPKTTQAERQMGFDAQQAELLGSNMGSLTPQFGQARNAGLATGATLGAIPPSLLALYLLAQQDEEDKQG
jgi:hypothetical protein